MIQEFVDTFMDHKDELRFKFELEHPDSYKSLVEAVIRLLHEKDEYYFSMPNPDKITLIDDGDYQGTLLFVIPEDTYQPSTYWYVKVAYGSCSGCDTLQSIRSYSDEPPTCEQVDDYMTLALHIVQGLKRME